MTDSCRQDRDWMLEAIAESRKGRFIAPPNPAVGCVIVRDGIEIARGYTHAPGSAHAEIDAINNAKSKSSDKAEEKIKIPELYHKGFPIDLEQAVRILEDCGLKSSTSKLTIKEANPRYRDCFDSQVIGSNPKQGALVKIGATVCLRYIPEEVIAESQRIFDETQRAKEEARERTKEKFSVAVQKTKQGAVKIFKRSNKVESIEEEVSDE